MFLVCSLFGAVMMMELMVKGDGVTDEDLEFLRRVRLLPATARAVIRVTLARLPEADQTQTQALLAECRAGLSASPGSSS